MTDKSNDTNDTDRSANYLLDQKFSFVWSPILELLAPL